MKHKRLIINAACAMLLIGCSLTAYAFADSNEAEPVGTHPASVHTDPNETATGSQTGDSTPANPQPMKPASPDGQDSTLKAQGKNAEAGQGGLKLNADNLNQCQKRQTEINMLQTRIVTRTSNQITLFNTVTQRVESFVAGKNLTIPDYSALASKLATDQSVVNADLTSLKANQTLDCGGTDPTGTLSDFRANVQNTFTDMQDYKSDLLKLIAAVKAAAEPNQKTGSQTKPDSQNTTPEGSQTGGSEE